MAEPASVRQTLEQLIVAAAGNAGLTAERAEEVRNLADQLARRWKGDAVRAGERAGAAMDGFFRELGLVTREEVDELELRLAQLEHRLRLVEGVAPAENDGRSS
jgi:polyhydroxyalkanoate synthesis regulator phasin